MSEQYIVALTQLPSIYPIETLCIYLFQMELHGDKHVVIDHWFNIFFPLQKLAEDLNNSNTNNANVDHVKRMYARQRAKDLAEHAKSVMSKEKELDDLRKQLSLQQSGQHLPVCICIKLFILHFRLLFSRDGGAGIVESDTQSNTIQWKSNQCYGS